MTSLTPVQKSDLCKLIQSHEEMHESIYILIRSFQLKHTPSEFQLLPFNAKDQKKGLKFDLDKLPIPLQNMILDLFKTKNLSE